MEIEQLLSDRFPMVALEFEYTAQIHRGVNKRTFLTDGGDSDRRQGDSRPRSVHPPPESTWGLRNGQPSWRRDPLRFKP